LLRPWSLEDFPGKNPPVKNLEPAETNQERLRRVVFPQFVTHGGAKSKGAMERGFENVGFTARGTNGPPFRQTRTRSGKKK